MLMMTWKELADEVRRNTEEDGQIRLDVLHEIIQGYESRLPKADRAKRILCWAICDLVEDNELPEVSYARLSDDQEDLYVVLSDWDPESIKEAYGYEPHESIADTIAEVIGEYWELQHPDEPLGLYVAMTYIEGEDMWKVDLLTEEEITRASQK